ncbi:MAG: hypothetical protein MMC23_000673 [Stictis urceolatum]|nr:hypothetical protein [Stictis urceolata]
MASLILGAAAITYDRVQAKKERKVKRKQHNERRYAELEAETEQWKTTPISPPQSPTPAVANPTSPISARSPSTANPFFQSRAPTATDEEWWNPTPPKKEDEWWKPPPPAERMSQQRTPESDTSARERGRSEESEREGRVRLEETPVPSSTRRKSAFGENTDAPVLGSRKGSVAGSRAGRRVSVISGKEGRRGSESPGEGLKRRSLGQKLLDRMNKAGESMGGGGGGTYH